MHQGPNPPLRLELRDTTFGVTITRGIERGDLVVGDSVMVVINNGVWLTSNPPIVPIRRVIFYRTR